MKETSMRIALVVASLALVGGTTVACGGSPEDASKEDFCEVMSAFPEAKDGKIKQDDWDDWVDEIKDTGTPKDIDDDARDGFETSVDLLEDVDVEADDEELTKDLEEAEDDLSKDEKGDVKAFDEYRSETCAAEVPSLDTPEVELPSDMPSDLPSGMPSDMPSVDPSDYESLMSDYESYLSENPTP